MPKTDRMTRTASKVRPIALAGFAATALVFAFTTTVTAQERVVNVYNWSDYITPEALEGFTKKTGIKVVYDVYDSNDVLDAKLLAGRSGYDVVFPSATPYFAKQITAGAYQKLDKSKLPNAAGVDPRVMRELRTADPENAYGLPYMMAGTGIGFNVAKVRERLPNAPTGSLKMLFDPAVLLKLKDCGITLLDAPEETFPAALAYAGHDPLDTSEKGLEIAQGVLNRARTSYRYIHSSAYIGDLANGATCVAMGYAGDLVQARSRAEEAKAGVEIQVILPTEGAVFNIDVMGIPKDAQNVAEAHAFIDFLLQPEVIGPISTAVGYANAVPASAPHISEDIRNDPAVNPPATQKLYTLPVVADDYQRARNRAWSRIKAKRR